MRAKDQGFSHCIKAMAQHKQMPESAADVRRRHHPATKEKERKRMRRGLTEISEGFLCLSVPASLPLFSLLLKFWADRNPKAFDTLLKTPHTPFLSNESPVLSPTHYQESYGESLSEMERNVVTATIDLFFFGGNFQIKFFVKTEHECCLCQPAGSSVLKWI